MKITIEDFEPLPVPEINCEPIYQQVSEFDFSKVFTEEQMNSIRQSTLEYCEKLNNEKEMQYKTTDEKAPLKFVDVYDNTIAAMMLREGFPYFARDDGDPYCFFGDNAVDRALYWEKFLNTEIPVMLTVKEAFVLSKMLKDNPIYGCYFGINGCEDKLTKAVFDRTDKK